MGYIAHLPKSVIGQLRSSSILSDLAQAVEELICNSLDAGAKKICVDIDLPSFYIKVEDDGSGVTRDDLKLIGERHATSKLHDMVDLESGVSTLGFRGEALSSLSDVGILEIITRVRGSPNTYKKIVKGSKKLSLGLYGDQRAPGTTVVLRDLFYNLPVRRKVIQASPRKVLQGVKDRTVRLALINPDVSFIVFDMDRQENLICTKSCSSSLDTLCEFFGEHLRHELNELHFAKKCLKVDGFISRETSRSSLKAIQFLYLNGRFVHKTPVHKLINTLFCRGNGGSELGNPPESGLSLIKPMYPMFLMNLHCPLSSYDITFEATKTSVEFKDWKSILEFITEALGTKWSRLMCISDEVECLPMSAVAEEPELKKMMPRKRKLPWQHVDPTYHSRCIKDGPKYDDFFDSVGGMQNAENVAKAEQDFTFHIPKGIRTPRKKRGYQKEHIISDSSTSSWNLQPCGARRKLESDFRILGNQRGQKGMDNPSYEKTLHESWRESSSSCVPCSLDDMVELKSGFCVKDVACRDNSSFTFTNLAATKTTGHFRKVFSSSYGKEDQLSLESVTRGESGYMLGLGEGTNAMIDFLQTPTQLFRTFSEGSSGVQRSVYEVNMKPSCSDSFFCHSERQNVSNFDIKHRHLDNENLWNDGSAALSTHIPGHQFSRGSETEKFLEDYICLSGIDPLLENESSFSPQEAGNDKFDPLLTDTSDKYFLLDKVGKRSQQQLLMLGTVEELIERPRSDEYLPYCSTSLTYDTEKEAFNKKRGGSSQQDCTKQTTSRDNLEGPTNGRLRRSLSGPPFYRPPRKYGARNGLGTWANQHKNSYKFQAAFEKDSQKERLIASPLKDGCQNLMEGVDFSLTKRGSQEEMLLHQDFDFSPANINGDDNVNSKWRDAIHDGMAATGVTAIQLYKNWKNPCIRSIEPSILALSSGILGPSNKHLLPENITKEALQNIQVLQQVDKKFIASVAERTLLVIDQHAADERIRLEQLRKEVLEKDQHLSTLLDYPKELSMNVGDQQLLHTYKTQVEEWGWRFKLIANGKNGKRSGPVQHVNFTVLLTAVPNILGESLINIENLSEYLHQLTTTDGTSVPPPAIQRVLASKACRGAIMFGDHLLRSECQQLIEGLKRTALSFQCAHGRPTLVPIVNLEALHVRLNKLHSRKISSSKSGSSTSDPRGSWHGLQWHRPTLVRAMERLQRAEQM